MRIQNGKVGGRASSFLIIETAEMSTGSQNSKTGCWWPVPFHVYLMSNLLMNSRLVCTPQICSLSTEVAVLSGSFVIAPRTLKKQPEGLKRSVSVSSLKYVTFFLFLRETEVVYLNLTKIQWLH